MKRHNNLFEQIISIENLKLADKNARRGKLKQKGVQIHLRREEANILKLHEDLKSGNFTTSEYTTFEIFDPKHRIISRLPYYPDRIIQHSLCQIIEPILRKSFIVDTYANIKGRGVHKASYNLRKALRDKKATKYCLKLDILQFYPSVDNDILKQMLRKKFKDKRLLALLDDIIDSTQGLALGNVTSQLLSNYYLSYLDHYIKQELRVIHLFRYCDDYVILGRDKKELHKNLEKIRKYLKTLNLEIKGNYQVFPVESRGIDFLGYVHFHTHTLIRKSIKKRFLKSKTPENFWGWLKHCKSKNLINRKINESSI